MEDEQQETTAQADHQALHETIEQLRESIGSFEQYEQPIGSNLYRQTIASIRWLRTVSGAYLDQPFSFEQPVMPKMLAGQIYVQADQLYVYIAAYQPYAKSRTLKHLWERRHITEHMRKLMDTTQRWEAALEPEAVPAST